jgi:hypothetical protein
MRFTCANFFVCFLFPILCVSRGCVRSMMASLSVMLLLDLFFLISQATFEFEFTGPKKVPPRD